MKRYTILYLLLLAPIAAWSQNYLDIFNKDLNDCKRAAALEYLQAFEDGDISKMTFSLSQGANFSVDEVSKYREQLNGRMGGSLVYSQIKDTTYFKRVYYTYEKRRKIYRFELVIHFEEDTPYVFKKITLSEKIKFPSKLRKILKQHEKTTTKEEAWKVMQKLKPQGPPYCNFRIGNRANKDQKTYLYNEFSLTPSFIKDAAPFNKSTLPIAMDIYARDSCNFSPAFVQLKRLEKLNLSTWHIDHFPEELLDLKGLKILHLRISKTDRFSIPSEIKKLQSLEELTIHCAESVGKIELPESLTQLNNLKRFKYSGENIATVDASANAVIRAVYYKPGMKLAQ